MRQRATLGAARTVLLVGHPCHLWSAAYVRAMSENALTIFKKIGNLHRSVKRHQNSYWSVLSVETLDPTANMPLVFFSPSDVKRLSPITRWISIADIQISSSRVKLSASRAPFPANTRFYRIPQLSRHFVYPGQQVSQNITTLSRRTILNV